MKKLLVLDVNGVLGIKEKKFKYYPEVKLFIKHCFLNYDVAFFSSMMCYNLDEVLINLLSEEQTNTVKFIYDRNNTDVDPEPINSWDTIKDVEKIKVLFPEHSVLICDNEARKLRFNNPKNCLICPGYSLNHFEKLKVLINNKFDDMIR